MFTKEVNCNGSFYKVEVNLEKRLVTVKHEKLFLFQEKLPDGEITEESFEAIQKRIEKESYLYQKGKINPDAIALLEMGFVVE